MAHFNIKIDDKLNFAIEQIAKSNNVSKSEVVREALRLYVNNMLADPINQIEKRLEGIEEKLSKELYRYNSLLAKNTLYTIAGRQHLIYYNAATRGNDEAKQLADRAWNVAVDRLKKPINEDKKDD
ncbi:ribbon-helix-helix domain-containing protein [Hydrogenimonas thermophila]|uniref:ribbon-helix-helix domain-containing protein n=1 Tax=Hydrogenimonas thermophila TaxID=223786 RepID=UPI0029373275|nr:ribbon-helix-helix domain-containing protein [Hydrogenimonas thermophila]WOE70486.1 ribbon-helix-helix domain-containing protein [Hydrogenimonas thermophila]WOE73003.1 ribbon-helix-helix domain-containing protein [Hydrogenimonas thermophila]